MPEYEYKCTACEHEFSVHQEMKKYKPKKKCPSCKKHKLQRVLGGFTAFVRSEPQTLGQLAERNTEKFGRYELEEKRRSQEKGKNVAEKDKPWYDNMGETSKADIQKMSSKQKSNYIRTGKK